MGRFSSRLIAIVAVLCIVSAAVMADSDVSSASGTDLPGYLIPDAMPGGSSTYYDSNAPKVIVSENLEFLELSCNFITLSDTNDYTYVYGYAAKVDAGVLVALQCSKGYYYDSDNEVYSAVAVVKSDVLSELQDVVSRYDFASHNGYSHYVSGLPQNFGGRVYACYSSGEYISFDDNQSPIISAEAGSEIVSVLKHYIEKKSIRGLKPKNIVSVEYWENRGDSDYTHYYLDSNIVRSESQYGVGKQVFAFEHAVGKDALETIRTLAGEYALLDWTGLRNDVWTLYDQSLVFRMKNGTEIAIADSMRRPGLATNIIFDVYMMLWDLEK